jgi:hypothetical protein
VHAKKKTVKEVVPGNKKPGKVGNIAGIERKRANGKSQSRIR